jgi:hypothetical protein
MIEIILQIAQIMILFMIYSEVHNNRRLFEYFVRLIEPNYTESKVAQEIQKDEVVPEQKES